MTKEAVDRSIARRVMLMKLAGSYSKAIGDAAKNGPDVPVDVTAKPLPVKPKPTPQLAKTPNGRVVPINPRDPE